MPFVTTPLRDRLGHLSRDQNMPLFCAALRGIEREALRVEPSGCIAQSAHPIELGSALTHPNITTDYSEALLEFITDPAPCMDSVLSQLTHLMTSAAEVMGTQMLWAGSMPCQLGQDSDVPVANYGSSNIGHMKHIYRQGLGHRYGRKMQTIAGIHFNYSLPDAIWAVLRAQDKSALTLQDYKTQGYFAMIRNFRRWMWLLLYLMGASPAICRSFINGRDHQLQTFGSDTHSLFAEYGTSLRMGDLGYQSDAQKKLVVCYNSLDRYIEILRSAILTDHPAYKTIGLKDEDGNYRQLSAGLLQIENEFYSTVRPKQTARRGETQLKALAERGVEYVEVRCLDLDPFNALGISRKQMCFLETFLLTCLLSPSPHMRDSEYRAIDANHRLAVYQGRDPKLVLERGDGSQAPLRAWGRELFESFIEVAEILDQANDSRDYADAVNHYAFSLDDDSLTPSARVLAGMSSSKQTYFRWTESRSRDAMQWLRAQSLSAEQRQHLEASAQQSLQVQAQMEASDQLEFGDYLHRYFDQYRQL